jgi:hypothetical protein
MVFSTKELELEQSETLKQLDLRERIYYKRFEDGSGRCVVLLVAQNGYPLARGVAIQSPKDNFEKGIGRLLARGRALRAIRRGHNSGDLMNSPALNEGIPGSVNDGMTYKSEINPIVTEFEKTLID